jgi:hypothetical protein
MSNKGQPSVYETEIEERIEEQETEKTDAEERNPTLDSETGDLNWAYDYYLEHGKYILNGIREQKYYQPWEAIEHVIQNDYLLNSEYVKLMRTIVEDSIKMRVKIEELERRQLEQRLTNLRKNGGSRKQYRNIKTIKIRSKKIKENV